MKVKLLFFLFFVLKFTQVFCQNTGPRSPLISTTGGVGASWSNLGGVQAPDNNMMYVGLADYPLCTNTFNCYASNTVHLENFGFSIPSNATITGLEVSILKRVGTPTNQVMDSILALTHNGIVISNNYATSSTWPLTFAYVNYGNSTDLWNAVLTPTIINSSTFGLDYKIINQFFSVTAQVDHVTLTIYYSLPSGISGIQSGSSNFVIPNPIGEQCTFHFSSIYSNAVLCLYNSNGLLQEKSEFSGSTLEMKRKNLPTGIYFYLVMLNGSVVERGKFTAE